MVTSKPESITFLDDIFDHIMRLYLGHFIFFISNLIITDLF